MGSLIRALRLEKNPRIELASHTAMRDVFKSFAHRLAWVAVWLFAAGEARALDPDQLLLIANKNVLESVKLAHYYARRRGVPEDQVLAIALPTTEDMSFEEYESELVPALRQFLREHSL